MSSGDVAYIVMAINPVGGLAVAIPFAIFKLGYPPWFALVAGLPLGYLQVVAVDVFWNALTRWPWWNGMIERRRSPRVQRMVESRGSFWLTLVFSPMVGPWLVMALMRYANVPHRRVALPLFLGLGWTAGALTLVCVYAPRFIAR